MIIVGQVLTEAEAKEITFMAKVFIVGDRARLLGGQA